jgi:hypothetical protein
MSYSEIRRTKPVASWTTQDVQVLLDHLELAALKPIFQKNGGA